MYKICINICVLVIPVCFLGVIQSYHNYFIYICTSMYMFVSCWFKNQIQLRLYISFLRYKTGQKYQYNKIVLYCIQLDIKSKILKQINIHLSFLLRYLDQTRIHYIPGFSREIKLKHFPIELNKDKKIVMIRYVPI